jgi:hypothetical protein
MTRDSQHSDITAGSTFSPHNDTLHVAPESHDHSQSCSRKQECTSDTKLIINAHRQGTAFQPMGCHLPAKKETLLQQLQSFIITEFIFKHKEHNNATG